VRVYRIRVVRSDVLSEERADDEDDDDEDPHRAQGMFPGQLGDPPPSGLARGDYLLGFEWDRCLARHGYA
jgi:hypothetical protein